MESAVVQLKKGWQSLQSIMQSYSEDALAVVKNATPYVIDTACLARISYVAYSSFPEEGVSSDETIDWLTLVCSVRLLYSGWNVALSYFLSRDDIFVDQRSSGAKIQYLAIKVLSLPKVRMLSFQNNLPRLPVPEVKKTCQRYLMSLEAVLSHDEFLATKNAVEEFTRPGGDGERLQAKLIKYDQLNRVKGCYNWVEYWWETFGYLSQSESLLFSTHWYGCGEFQNKSISMTDTTAQAINYMVDWLLTVRSRSMPPEKLFDIIPLDMSQYERMFGTTRVPGLWDDNKPLSKDNVLDKLVTCDKSKHIVVFVKDQIYKLDLFNNSGERKPLIEIKRDLLAIKSDAKQRGEGKGLSLLTGQQRHLWYQHRQELMGLSETNRQSLAVVEDALFAIAIEDAKPETFTDQAKQAFLSPHNRWYDKNMVFVIYDNHKSGGNMEHTWGEATVGTAMYEYANQRDYVELPPVDTVNEMQPLKWNINDTLEQAIGVAREVFEKKASRYDIESFVYGLEEGEFTKEWIKGKSLSPDAFIQAAIQLTYYKLDPKGETLPYTYETCTTRRYSKGRTETIRTASPKMKAFVQSMVDPNCSIENKRNLFRQALDHHKKLTKEALLGQGVDRHLLGLKLLALYEKRNGEIEMLPSIFTAPGSEVSTDWNLLTSQTPSKSDQYSGVKSGGFSPPTKGYGVSYQIYRDRIFFHVSTYFDTSKTSSEAFKKELLRSLSEMKKLFD